MQELIEIGVLVVATRTLGEALRGDVLAAVEAELQGVLTFDVADVVRRLIEVLDGELRGVAVRAEGDIALIVELEGWELHRGRDR